MGFLTVLSLLLLAEAQVRPIVSQRTFGERVHVVRVAPRYATALRMPDAISSVVVGDPAKFLAEHSDKEPMLVIVKPVVEEEAESNLLITTTKGRQVSFLLRSEGRVRKPVDFVLIYKQVGTFLVDESEISTAEVPRTDKLEIPAKPQTHSSMRQTPFESACAPEGGESRDTESDPLDRLLERQRRAPIPVLYEARAPSPQGNSEPVRAGISEIIDEGRRMVVLFSVVNPQPQAIEILPPQIQLAGQSRSGFIVRHNRWGTSEQIPVNAFRLSRHRLGAGERADGVVVFTRPNFKQSNESLFLQVAESGAIDKPALVPIGFGVSAARKEATYVE